MGALQNVRMLDLSMLFPGNYCSMLLADLGADVIKIEPPGGDPARFFQPQKDGMSYWHIALNRNKKSVTLDLKTARGKKSLLALAKDADILFESFRPGVMARLGLSYETMAALNPRLIYCSLSGYGDFSEKAAHDLNICAMTGVLSGDGAPFIGEAQLAGTCTAQQAAVGILAALQARQHTGRGQFVEVTMLRSTLSLMSVAMSNVWGQQDTGTPRYPRKIPKYNIYKTKDGKFITVGAMEDKFWRRLCEVLDIPELKDRAGDRAAFPELFDRLEGLFAQKTRSEWEEVFAGEDVCLTPVYDVKEAVDKNLARGCGMEAELTDDKLGAYRQVGLPIRLSDTPAAFNRRAPYLGEHNEEILGSLAEDML